MKTTIHYRFENNSKQRYYKIYFFEDLFGDWIITKAWGSLHNASGRALSQRCQSFEEGLMFIERITKTRKQRGYVLCTSSCDGSLINPVDYD